MIKRTTPFRIFTLLILLCFFKDQAYCQTNIYPASGNVGIGTLSPAGTVHVNASNVSNIWVTGGSSANDYYQLLLSELPVVNGNYACLERYSNASSFGGKMVLSNLYKSILLSTGYTPQTGYRNDLSITSGGDIGIGTSSPSQKLHVSGGGIQVSDYNSAFLLLQSTITGGRAWNLASLTDGSTAGAVGSFVILDNTAGTTRMLIDNSGNVGIGTSTPQAKLSVNGSIFSTKVKVTQDGWPDYVFHENYSLTPLDQLQAFIRKNNRLPDMPSAEEVKKNGIDLGDNQAVLLKKIEELTLYILEQNKELKEQKERIAALEKKVK